MRSGSPGPTSPTSQRPERFLPPFLGARFRSEAAAVLLFTGFRAWNLRCPCAMIDYTQEGAEL